MPSGGDPCLYLQQIYLAYRERIRQLHGLYRDNFRLSREARRRADGDHYHRADNSKIRAQLIWRHNSQLIRKVRATTHADAFNYREELRLRSTAARDRRSRARNRADSLASVVCQ
jgi:hypothetical protein